MFITLRRASVLALGLVLATGCSSEHATAPVARPSAQSADLLGTVESTVDALHLVTGLRRTTPLVEPITVAKRIDARGGALIIPEAGVSVIVPPGALEEPTTITMTARAGYLVAYDFSPHGITFDRPLVFTQKLSGTNATILSAQLLQLGYYEDPSLLGEVTATVSELIDGLTNLFTWTFSAPIKHFSGYLVTCGRE